MKYSLNIGCLLLTIKEVEKEVVEGLLLKVLVLKLPSGLGRKQGWWLWADKGPLHTQDWEPVTIALQALSLVEKAVLVQVCFTLRLRGQMDYVNARWM